MTLHWFLSRTVRQATQMRRHVHKILNHQRDVLSPQAVNAVNAAMEETQAAIERNPGRKVLLEKMAHLEKVANTWLKQYPNAGLRENIDVLLVAIAVAMGIRTFFLQPFKIPTGSMQPTLYGITHENLIDEPDATIPNPVARFFSFWINGVSYTHIVAKSEGVVTALQEAPQRFLLFNLKQRFQVGNEWYTVWFPPDNLFRRAGLEDGYNRIVPHTFKKGEDIIKLKVISGDHLFVDRLTYNFRRPDRGEIIVFETDGIEALPQGQFYIKRLVAKGGEHVRIGNDRHLIINGKRLDATTPHFSQVYSFNPTEPPEDSVYSGHVNGLVAGRPGLAPLLPDERHEFVVKPKHYMVMGDNTLNSFDSRSWGDFPREKVIGKSYFVYWPITAQNGRASRFGWTSR